MLNLRILHCTSFALYEGCAQEKARIVFFYNLSSLWMGVFLTHEIMCNVLVVVVDLGHLAHKKYIYIPKINKT
jgi:hypothetical protein